MKLMNWIILRFSLGWLGLSCYWKIFSLATQSGWIWRLDWWNGGNSGLDNFPSSNLGQPRGGGGGCVVCGYSWFRITPMVDNICIISAHTRREFFFITYASYLKIHHLLFLRAWESRALIKLLYSYVETSKVIRRGHFALFQIESTMPTVVGLCYLLERKRWGDWARWHCPRLGFAVA